VKESGLVVPLVCALWLAHERRWRDVVPYLASPVALSGWILAVALQTGHWMGNADFAQYNLYEPLRPWRILVAFVRRLYFLVFANFHWIGAYAALIAWRRTRTFQSRSWRIAGLMVAAHVVLFTLLGGAILERYLLPVLPIVYTAMAAGLWQLSRTWKLGGTVVMLAGFVACSFVYPSYSFPLENNLAFTDFLKLHSTAAEYLESRYPGTPVHTLWPMTVELSHPEFSFVERGLAVRLLPDLMPATLDSVDWKDVQVLAAFSRDVPLPRIWQRLVPRGLGVSRQDVRAHIPFPPVAQFDRHGQWVDIYVNPGPRL
jgi:hypothetical protein